MLFYLIKIFYGFKIFIEDNFLFDFILMNEIFLKISKILINFRKVKIFQFFVVEFLYIMSCLLQI